MFPHVVVEFLRDKTQAVKAEDRVEGLVGTCAAANADVGGILGGSGACVSIGNGEFELTHVDGVDLGRISNEGTEVLRSNRLRTILAVVEQLCLESGGQRVGCIDISNVCGYEDRIEMIGGGEHARQEEVDLLRAGVTT